MAKDVRIWEIEKEDSPHEIKRTEFDLEKRLESWLEKDISILSEDLLIIGRQVKTDFGGVIDLLCLDQDGNTVIVELKRDKTPREITAQVLDYASWVKDLSHERITDKANEYLEKQGGNFEEAFNIKFGEEIPETLNQEHRMLIVASRIDSSSERIINYLSDTHGVDINAVTFHYFKDEQGKEFMARIFFIEPDQVEYKTMTKGGGKRKSKLSYMELSQMARENGVSEMYEMLFKELEGYFEGKRRTLSSIAFTGNVLGIKKGAIFSLIPTKSNPDDGLMFQVFIYRFSEYFGIDLKEAESLLPTNRKKWAYYDNAPQEYQGFEGYFKNMKEVEDFLSELDKIKKN